MPTNNVDIQNIETSRHYVSVTGTVNGQQVAGTLRIPIVAEKLGITVEALNLQISSKNLSADLSKILAIRLAEAFKERGEVAAHPETVVIDDDELTREPVAAE